MSIQFFIFTIHFSPTLLILLLFFSTYQGLFQTNGATPPALSRVEIATSVIQQFIKGIDSDKCDLTKHTTNLCDPKFPIYQCAFFDKYKQNVLSAIDYNGCNIVGQNISLVNFLENLSDLTIFHANSNNFAGEIPILSNLNYLSELDLSNNKFTGKFPMNVLGATQLAFLDLRFNSFEGPIPSELFNLKLTSLFINNNNFGLDLPSNLGSTPAAFIVFANNKFTGPIPKSIGQASNTLQEFVFLNNQLSGCLPHEIGLLQMLRVFDVSTNLLTGPIPPSFASLKKIEFLVLANNTFYGPIPEEVCKLPLLKKLILADNYFTQVGPECTNLIQQKVMDVNGNCIVGLANQKSPEICGKFFNEPKTCDDYGKRSTYSDSNVANEGVLESEPLVTYAALNPKRIINYRLN